MAPLRAPRLAIQRLAHMHHGLVHSSFTTMTVPGAIIFPCLNLTNQNRSRFSSSWGRVTAFEQAMQELYGVGWKTKLNSRQRTYVKSHEQRRETRMMKLQELIDAGLEDPDAPRRQPEDEWRAKVERTKEEIRWRRRLLTIHGSLKG
ncbi:hypothetical protein VM1G_10199 [Cytospora mali]|uniref:Uncharacterized protein n=1 Tax=Cytospora mali TaxID=578113 RepID=A0A194VHC1_CYTMA|nr:hypothetical protein VM1G_10199 [Valsa mali]